MLSRRPVTGVAMVCVGLLTACGITSTTSMPSTTPTSTASPVAGTPFNARRFTTVIPAQWSDRSTDQAEVSKFNGGGDVLLLVEQGPPGIAQTGVSDVRANISVVALTTPVADDKVAAYLGTVTTRGGTNLSSPRPFTIDGSTGIYITENRDILGTPGESRDMVVNHAGTTYEILYNTSAFAFEQQLTGLQAVLAAWRWNR